MGSVLVQHGYVFLKTHLQSITYREIAGSSWVSLVTSGTRGGLLAVARPPSVRRGSMSWVALLLTLSWDPNVFIPSVLVEVTRNTVLFALTLATLLGDLKPRLVKHVSLTYSTMLATMSWFVPKLW